MIVNPDFGTMEEFASFVETHDMTDYLHEFEEVEVERFPKERISLSIPDPLLQTIKAIAEHQGIHYEALIRRWLCERLVWERRETEGKKRQPEQICY